MPDWQNAQSISLSSLAARHGCYLDMHQVIAEAIEFSARFLTQGAASPDTRFSCDPSAMF